MSNGKGKGPEKGYNLPAYRANYDRIFRATTTRRPNPTRPVTPVTADTLACPACDASWRGSPIPAPYREHHGDQTHYSRLLAIEEGGDHVTRWKCPDCGEEWTRQL